MQLLACTPLNRRRALPHSVNDEVCTVTPESFRTDNHPSPGLDNYDLTEDRLEVRRRASLHKPVLGVSEFDGHSCDTARPGPIRDIAEYRGLEVRRRASLHTAKCSQELIGHSRLGYNDDHDLNSVEVRRRSPLQYRDSIRKSVVRSRTNSESGRRRFGFMITFSSSPSNSGRRRSFGRFEFMTALFLSILSLVCVDAGVDYTELRESIASRLRGTQGFSVPIGRRVVTTQTGVVRTQLGEWKVKSSQQVKCRADAYNRNAPLHSLLPLNTSVYPYNKTSEGTFWGTSLTAANGTRIPHQEIKFTYTFDINPAYRFIYWKLPSLKFYGEVGGEMFPYDSNCSKFYDISKVDGIDMIRYIFGALKEPKCPQVHDCHRTRIIDRDSKGMLCGSPTRLSVNKLKVYYFDLPGAVNTEYIRYADHDKDGANAGDEVVSVVSAFACTDDGTNYQSNTFHENDWGQLLYCDMNRALCALAPNISLYAFNPNVCVFSEHACSFPVPESIYEYEFNIPYSTDLDEMKRFIYERYPFPLFYAHSSINNGKAIWYSDIHSYNVKEDLDVMEAVSGIDRSRGYPNYSLMKRRCGYSYMRVNSACATQYITDKSLNTFYNQKKMETILLPGRSIIDELVGCLGDLIGDVLQALITVDSEIIEFWVNVLASLFSTTNIERLVDHLWSLSQHLMHVYSGSLITLGRIIKDIVREYVHWISSQAVAEITSASQLIRSTEGKEYLTRILSYLKDILKAILLLLSELLVTLDRVFDGLFLVILVTLTLTYWHFDEFPKSIVTSVAIAILYGCIRSHVVAYDTNCIIECGRGYYDCLVTCSDTDCLKECYYRFLDCLNACDIFSL